MDDSILRVSSISVDFEIMFSSNRWSGILCKSLILVLSPLLHEQLILNILSG